MWECAKCPLVPIELMRVVEDIADATRHVVLADIMDLAESWGEELGEAAWAIARDYYESKPEDVAAIR
jgi:hypothetical protein